MYNLMNFRKDHIPVTITTHRNRRWLATQKPTSCPTQLQNSSRVQRGVWQSGLCFRPLLLPWFLASVSPALSLFCCFVSLKGHLFLSLLAWTEVSTFPQEGSSCRCQCPVPTPTLPLAFTVFSRPGTSAGLWCPGAGDVGLVWLCVATGFSS